MFVNITKISKKNLQNQYYFYTFWSDNCSFLGFDTNGQCRYHVCDYLRNYDVFSKSSSKFMTQPHEISKCYLVN